METAPVPPQQVGIAPDGVCDPALCGAGISVRGRRDGGRCGRIVGRLGVWYCNGDCSWAVVSSIIRLRIKLEVDPAKRGSFLAR